MIDLRWGHCLPVMDAELFTNHPISLTSCTKSEEMRSSRSPGWGGRNGGSGAGGVKVIGTHARAHTHRHTYTHTLALMVIILLHRECSRSQTAERMSWQSARSRWHSAAPSFLSFSSPLEEGRVAVCRHTYSVHSPSSCLFSHHLL